jgi:hypothetical protein
VGMMEELNKWMIEYYGYSWDEHEAKLIKEGYERTDIVDELIGLTYVHIVLTNQLRGN